MRLFMCVSVSFAPWQIFIILNRFAFASDCIQSNQYNFYSLCGTSHLERLDFQIVSTCSLLDIVAILQIVCAYKSQAFWFCFVVVVIFFSCFCSDKYIFHMQANIALVAQTMHVFLLCLFWFLLSYKFSSLSVSVLCAFFLEFFAILSITVHAWLNTTMYRIKYLYVLFNFFVVCLFVYSFVRYVVHLVRLSALSCAIVCGILVLFCLQQQRRRFHLFTCPFFLFF